MGVRGLYKLISEIVGVRRVKLKDMRGWRIGIDANLHIYRWHSIKILNADGRPINHLQGAFFSTVKMLMAGITPVYIFDGVPPMEKAATIEARQAARAAGKSVGVSQDIIEETKQLLRLMGVQVIQAPGEAEAQAAYLAKLGKLDAVYTNDIDALIFGAPRVIMCEDRLLTTHEILDKLGLTSAQLVDLAILCGCDYTGRVEGYGPKRALAFIRSGRDLSEFDNVKGFDYKAARRAYLTPNVADFDIMQPRRLTAEDIDIICNFLMDRGFSRGRIMRTLGRLSQAGQAGRDST